MTVQTLRTAPGPQPPRQPKPHRITRTGENSQEIRATLPRTAMHRRNADPTIPATRGDFSCRDTPKAMHTVVYF